MATPFESKRREPEKDDRSMGMLCSASKIIDNDDLQDITVYRTV